jgi:hypothetical protein
MADRNSIELSVMDFGYVGASALTIDFVFAYPKGLCIERLQRGLDRVLTDFSPLTSEIEYDRSRDRWVFAPGARRVEIEERSDGGRRLDSVRTVPGEPLLRVVLSRGAERDHLGVSMSHAAGDGFSFAYFLTSWCAAVRGEGYPTPNHDRAALDALADAEASSRKPRPEELFDVTGMSWVPGLHRERLALVACERERFLPSLRVEGVSQNAALAAECLRQWVRTAGGAGGVRLACAVDLRHRAANVEKHYFGNASYAASCRWSRAAYEALPDADVARQVYRAIQRTDESTARAVVGALASLFRHEGSGVSSFLHAADPGAGILVTNLSRFPLATLDFGTGGPLYFAIVTVAANAVVVTVNDREYEKSTGVPLGPKNEPH